MKYALGILFIAVITLPTSWAQEADPSRGPDIFQNNCKPCHSTDRGAKPDMYGFNLTLYGIMGRQAGGIDGFVYSDAMMDSGIVWDSENMEEWLIDPWKVMPDTRMVFFGLTSEQDRKDLIAYFESLKD